MHKILNALQVADVCGLFQTGSRNIINGRVFALTSVGWFGWGLPLKNVIINDSTLYCPMVSLISFQKIEIYNSLLTIILASG